MIIYRRKLGQWFTRTVGEGSGMTSGTHEKTGDRVYGWLITGTVIFSVIIVMFLPYTLEQYSLALLWGVLGGWGILLFFPPKFIVTLLGGFLSLGTADLAGIATAVEESNKGLERLVTALSSGDNSYTITPGAFWIFILLIILFCLPAYGHGE